MSKKKKDLVDDLEKTDEVKSNQLKFENYIFIECKCGDKVRVYKDSSTNCPSCGNNLKYE